MINGMRDFFVRRAPVVGRGIVGAWFASWLVITTPVSALPQGGQITHGAGSIDTPSAGQMTINQLSQRMAADFVSFDIAAGNAVNVLQPGTSAVFLARVIGDSGTSIFGTLSSNGAVVLMNPRGVVFGDTARVNTAGLLATTLGVDTDRFMSGAIELEFTAEMAGKVINRGVLEAASGGSITLLGDEVINDGLIIADLGRVNLASGSEAYVTFDPDGLIGVRITQGALGGTGGDAAVANLGEIRANGGQIFLQANSARDLFSMAVNNEGVLRANQAEMVDGEVRLFAAGGDTYSSGTIEATAAAGRGGAVEVLGDRVALTGGEIDVSGSAGGGTIKIGGAFQGQGETPTASHTHVGPDVRLSADAQQRGDGGEVIVWADDTTRFYGEISARGGPDGGDGGFAEVSGKRVLAYAGRADLRAPQGATGTLLLDPTNINITDGQADVGMDTTVAPFVTADPDPEAASTLTWSTILTNLATADVHVTTDAGFDGGQVGDIAIVESPNAQERSGVYDVPNTLRLTTAVAGSIFVNAEIANAGSGGITFDSNTINLNANVSTAGGSIVFGDTLLGNVSLGGDVEVDTGVLGGDIAFNGTLDGGHDLGLRAGSGSLIFTGAVGGAVRLGALEIVSAGDVTANGIRAASFTQLEGTGRTTFNGGTFGDDVTEALDVDAGVAVTNETITLNHGLSAGSSVILDASVGQLLIDTDGRISVGAEINLNGATGISLGADLTTVDTLIAVNSDLVLTADVAMSTGPGVGNIVFGGTVDSDAWVTPRNLTLAAGSGDIAFDAAVGGAARLGAVTVNEVSNLTTGAAFTADSFEQAVVGLGNTTLGGLLTAEAGGVTLAALGVTLNGGIRTFGEAVSVQAGEDGVQLAVGQAITTTAIHSGQASGAIGIEVGGAGTVNLGGALVTTGADNADGTGSAGGRISIATGEGAIALADLTSDGGAAMGGDFDGGAAGEISITTGTGNLVTLNASTLSGAGGAGAGTGMQGAGTTISFAVPVLLTGGAASISTTSGDITFGSTVDGAQDLNLTAGTGNLIFTGAVGGAVRLGALDIVSAGTVTANAITAASLIQRAGAGITTLNGAVNTDGTGGVSLIGTNLQLNAGITTTNSGGVTFDQAGTVTIATAGDIASAGAVSLSGAGGISTAGNITTENAAVTFVSATSLTGAVAIGSGPGGGNIGFDASIDGGHGLTLTAGSGNLTFTGVVGGTERLGALDIVNAGDVTANAITAASLIQQAGAGITTLNGAVNTDGAGGVSLTGTNLQLNAGITTTNSGGVNFDQAGTVTIATVGDIASAGAVSLSGAGGISTAGDILAAGPIDFTQAVTLTGDIAVTATDSDITFSSSIDGGSDLVLTAGTGNLTFTGAVGGAERLGALEIVSAGDVTANGVRAARFTQLEGTGRTTLNGAVDTNAAAGVSLSGTHLSLNGIVTTTNGGVTLDYTGTATIAAGGDVNSAAAVSLRAIGGISTAGNVVAAGNVTFDGAVVLGENVSVDSSVAGGDITFTSTIDHDGTPRELRVIAGAGDVVFEDSVGAGGALSRIELSSADDARFTSAVSAGTVALVAASGTVSFNGVLTASDLSVADGVNNVSLLRDGSTITNAVTFANTGTTILGSGATDRITFAGGVNTTATSNTRIAGTVESSDNDIALGATTLVTNVTLDTGAGLGRITTGGIVRTDQSFTLDAGAGAVDIASINGVGDLTVARSGAADFGSVSAGEVSLGGVTGAVAFNGTVTASGVSAAAGAYDVTFAQGATVSGAGSFLNDSGVTFGGGGTFDDGITVAGRTMLAGTIGTEGGDINLAGLTTLTSSAGLASAGGDVNTTTVASAGHAFDLAAGAGAISLGAFTGGGALSVLSSGGGTFGAIDAGAITLNDSTGALAFGSLAAASITANGSPVAVTFAQGPTVAGAGIFANEGGVTFGSGGTFGAALSVTGPTRLAGTLASNGSMTLSEVSLNGASVVASSGGDINLRGIGSAGRSLTLEAQAGDIRGTSFAGDGTLVIASARDALLTGDVAASTVSLGGITGSVTFAGDTSISAGLTVSAGAYDMAFTGADHTIAGITTFANTGSVTLGSNAASRITFNGGVDTRPTSVTVVAGAVETVDADMTLGAVTLGAGSRLATGAGSGNLIAGAVDAAGNALVVNGGAGDVGIASLMGNGALTVAGGRDVTFAGPVLASTVTLEEAMGTIAFRGNTAITSGLSTLAGDFDVAFTGTTNSVAGSTAFINTGTVTLGDAAGDGIRFMGGVDTRATGGTRLAGTVSTANADLMLGATVLDGDARVRSGSGIVDLGAVSGDFALALQADTPDSTGAVSFNGRLDVAELVTFSQNYAVSLLGGGTVDAPTVFLNTGALTLGDAADDSLMFAGGLSATGNVTEPSSVSVAGNVATRDAPLRLGNLSLNAATTLSTGVSGGGGPLAIGAVLGGGHDFGLSAGTESSVSVGRIADVATVTFAAGGAVRVLGAVEAATASVGGVQSLRVDGAVDLTALETSASGTAISLFGGGTIARRVVLLNTGGITFGNGGDDEFLLAGGLDNRGGLTTLNGFVRSGGADFDLGGVSVAGDSVLDVTNRGDPTVNGASITIAGPVVSAAGDGALDLRAGTGDIAVSGGVENLGGFFVRSGGALELGDVRSNGAIRTVTAGPVSLNGDVRSESGDVSFFSTAGRVSQGNETRITAANGNVHLVGFDAVDTFEIHAPNGDILLGLLTSEAGGTFNRVGPLNRLTPDFVLGGVLAVVSGARADFGSELSGFRIQGAQEFISLADGSSFIEVSSAASLNTLSPIAQQRFIGAFRQDTPSRLPELRFDSTGTLADVLRGAARAQERLTIQAQTQTQAAAQQSEEDEMLSELTEEVFVEIALYDYDRQRALCLPEAMQGFDGAPCAGQVEPVADGFEDLTQEAERRLEAARAAAAPHIVGLPLAPKGSGGE